MLCEALMISLMRGTPRVICAATCQGSGTIIISISDLYLQIETSNI